MKIKRLLLVLFFSLVQTFQAQALDMGFNQGWLEQNFSEQWMTDRYFVPGGEAERILDLAKTAGATKLRMWVFSGFVQSGIVWAEDEKTPIGLDDKFQLNMIKFLLAAKQRGIRINLTLFTGTLNINLENVAINHGPELAEKYISRWSDIFNLRENQHINFQNNVLKPLLDILNDQDLRGVVTEVDIMNEFNFLIRASEGAYFETFEDSSQSTVANHFICSFSSFVKNNTLAPKPLISASVAGLDAEMILNNIPTESCVDYFTVHNYDDAAKIPSCHKIRRYAARLGKFAQLGEFGQSSLEINDALQSSNLTTFIENTRECGFKGAMAWRLSDIRPGQPDERFSFESMVGLTRPAYDDFRFLADRYGTDLQPVTRPPIIVQPDPPHYYDPGRRKRRFDDCKWYDLLCKIK